LNRSRLANRPGFAPEQSQLPAYCAIVALGILNLGYQPCAQAWDSRTHELIVRLAIAGLPDSPIKATFERESAQLQRYAVEPDSVLRPLYGQAEARRHYVDLENFGTNPISRLRPEFAAMVKQYGEAALDHAGTLPWAIEQEAGAMASAARDGNCALMIRHAGYLAHYVGDASQPLHTTRFYDGYTGSDRGLHARLEAAADHQVREIENAARPQVQRQAISSVWTPTVAELQQANALVAQVIEADRSVRAEGAYGQAYDRALMGIERELIVRQIADAASVLASIWYYESTLTGVPADCSSVKSLG
jgi:hypothetical protein